MDFDPRFCCLECRCRSTFIDTMSIEQIIDGQSHLIETEVTRCSSCGWHCLKDHQIDALLQKVKKIKL